MGDEVERKIARNEALLREVNESIERGRWPGEDSRPLKFRCECASLDCNEMIALTQEEYEQVRSHGRRFAIQPGHHVEECETVVASHDSYCVVEKLDEAGEAAERLDPRSQ
jgi:hypothetical protein